MYHNVLAQTSQLNLVQQPQQQQPNNQQQPMQSQQYYCYPTNQQGNYGQNQYGQPYQQEAYSVGQQQIPRSGVGNLGQPIGQTTYNIPSIMQNQVHGYGSLPAHILDQIRTYIGTPAPIFILPNNCPSPVASPPASIAPTPSMTQGCPGIGINCPSAPVYYPQGYPYPMPLPHYSPFAVTNHNQSTKESTKNCGCCSRKFPGNSENHTNSSYFAIEPEEHHCSGGNDDTICTKRNCPSAINLQALASQLLAIQGIIACSATRLVLRKVAGSNITSSVEETIERAKRSLGTLTQEQLLSETRHAQQVNALINLHMTANPPPNVIPILTTVQLKVNLLKAHVDSSINRRLSESQGAEGNGTLDPVILALKSDQELRDLLGTLRQKECEERVNLNFAPYQSQRVIAESRLSNLQNKIGQVEAEMQRRRGAIMSCRPSVAQQFSDPGWYGYTGDVSNSSSSAVAPNRSTQNYDSPDPFRFQVRNPKRLNLQPHVGSPETTYDHPKKTTASRSSRARKDSDDEDCEDNGKNSGRDPSAENHRCACDKSSEEDSADEGKKKLGGKIHVGRDLGNEDNGQKQRGVSILKLSKNVVIVIDNPCDGLKIMEDRGDNKRNAKVETKNEVKTKIAESERPDEMKGQSSVGTMVNDSEKTTNSGSMVDKMKKFKWGKKKEITADEKVEKIIVDPPEVEIKREITTEENYNTKQPVTEVKQGKIDYFRDTNGLEPVREQTVRMITKIDYEPSVFRAFLNHVDEPPEKENVIEERFKGSFTEDSLKSTSTESSVDSSRTQESTSLRVEELARTSNSQVTDHKELDISTSPVETRERSEAVTEQDKIEEESSRMKGKINNTFTRSHRSVPSRHNDDNEKAASDELQSKKETLEPDANNDDVLISGALTTIGNHVASFGSIIGKIATLKLHQVAESSHTLFGDNSTKEPIENHTSVDENEAGSSGTGKSTKFDSEVRKEIGRWKYIKFADVNDSVSATTVEDNSNNEAYALPKIKHSVIENKSRGSKYVVIEEPSDELRRELGEPYKTGRCLVIMSRPKSPQSNSSKQSEPITVVKGPKHGDRNCLALQIVSTKSSKKNRCKDNRDLKSSDKFWLRPEAREEESVDTNEMEKSNASGSETLKLSKNDTANSGKNTVAESGTSVNDEHIVQVHEYSSKASTPKKLLSQPGNIDNTDTVVSSIA